LSDRHDDTLPAPEAEAPDVLGDDLDDARENVFDGWPELLSEPDREPEPEPEEAMAGEDVPEEAEPEAVEPHAVEPFAAEAEGEAPVEAEAVEHAPAELAIPPGYSVLEGSPDGSKRTVGVVVARFNGEVTTRLLADAIEELERSGVDQDAITVMPVPGAFELPLAAMALAKTRRYAAVVALGCVIRGDTPHFDYVASEAASGLQLAALETGVPVAFGVLTLDSADQAEERIAKGSEAVRTALEMADLFANLRAASSR
jgi:6,7-dimethyl-8-ribityllumazine synthase